MTSRQRAYRAFLKTPFWKETTERKKAVVGKCERCHAISDLQSHHTFYRSDWFETQLEDLEVLCRGCHEEEHFGPIPDWESPEYEKKYFFGLVLEAGRFISMAEIVPDDMADEMDAIATKYRDSEPVVFQIRNCLRFATSLGLSFKSSFAPLEEPHVR